MRTSIATVCLSGTLEEKMRAAQQAGFDGIEIFEQDLVVSPTSPEEVADLARELGLELDLYQPFRDFEGVEEAQFERNLRRAEAKFRLLRRMGMSSMLLCSNVATATIDDDAVVAGQLRRLGELADGYGIDVAYEALAWGRFVSEYDHAWELVRAADHPRIGTCLDSFHILSRGTSLETIAEIPGEKIFFLQLADAPALTMDVLSWSRHHRVFPGEGAWDLPDFLTRVARTGYAGPVSLEVFNDSFRQADTLRTAEDGLRSLRWLESKTAEALTGTDRSGIRLDLVPLPHVEQPQEVTFVELSTDQLGALSRLLHQLGFTFTGYHRTKPHVQLWTQGQARIIISELDDEGGHVGRTYLRGIGFDVADPEAAMHRAGLLHATEVPREQSHDEEVLRGVFAPDGSEVFFCAATGSTPAWVQEFGDDHGHPDARIDHVNLAQPSRHYDESVMFYTSLLALQARTAQDVPSPSGLVRSQVMASDDDAIRMPLNVSPVFTERSAAQSDPYPEHVAIACADIFAAAETARARGLEFLTVPENYYEDLASVFDVEPELLRRLEENHILYDEDEHGAFLHFFTTTLGSIFLEMVERREGYRGFGAKDAPVRLASQYRLSRESTPAPGSPSRS